MSPLRVNFVFVLFSHRSKDYKRDEFWVASNVIFTLAVAPSLVLMSHRVTSMKIQLSCLFVCFQSWFFILVTPWLIKTRDGAEKKGADQRIGLRYWSYSKLFFVTIIGTYSHSLQETQLATCFDVIFDQGATP